MRGHWLIMPAMTTAEFDLNCRLCTRLAGFLDGVRADYPDYHARPVPPVGAAAPRLLIVGLAPGFHGANATGRPFTGDHAGLLLYRTLYDFGFSNSPVSSHARDGLKLKNCRITNAVKCLPPENKPLGEEVRRCNSFLAAELRGLPAGAVILALGAIAHGAVIRALKLTPKDYIFGHGREHALPSGGWLISSYHCSRYNTQTGRLTEAMFREIFAQVQRRLP